MNLKILILPILIILIIGFGLYFLRQQTVVTSSGEIPHICNLQVKYTTNKKINNSKDAQKAFEEYVIYLKHNNLIDTNLAIDWIFKSASPKGFYKEKFYWLIDFHFFTKEDKEKGGNAQIYISEDGEITRLLGCV